MIIEYILFLVLIGNQEIQTKFPDNQWRTVPHEIVTECTNRLDVDPFQAWPRLNPVEEIDLWNCMNDLEGINGTDDQWDGRDHEDPNFDKTLDTQTQPSYTEGVNEAQNDYHL